MVLTLLGLLEARLTVMKAGSPVGTDLPSFSTPKMCSADSPVCTPCARVLLHALVVEVGAVSMKVFLKGSHFRAQQDMKEVIQTPFLL